MTDEPPISLDEQRDQRIMDNLLGALSEGFSQASNNPLPYHLGLQSASLETTRRDLPTILRTLAAAQPQYWNFGFSTEEAVEYYYSQPNFHLFLEHEGERIRNQKVIPLLWIINDLQSKGHLDDLSLAKVKFRSRDAKQWYVDTELDTLDKESINPLCSHPSHLSRDLITRNAETYQFVLQAAVYSADIGGRIIQNVCRSLEQQGGWLVACSKQDLKTGASEGVVYSPREFAGLSYDELINIDELIDRRLR